MSLRCADAHCHLDFPAFDGDREAVVARARAAGVQRWVIAGTRPTEWDRTVRIARETGGTAVLGVHPWWAEEADDAALQRLREADVAGIGEIGLDWARAGDASERATQVQALRAQLAVARERDLPVVFHCVRAAHELLPVLERDGLPPAGAMVHGWTGPVVWAERAVALGIGVSFGPGVGRRRRARESAASVPAEALHVETDAPEGGREPAHVVEVLRELAELRPESAEELGAIALANLERLIPG